MAMLSRQDHSRSRVAGSTQRSRLSSLLVTVVGLATKGLQVEYHRMGRLRVDKKIFEAPWWLPSPMSIKDRTVLSHVEKAMNSTNACRIYE
jgi:hypothetical protein